MRSNILRLALVASVALAASACSDPETAKRQYLESGNRFAAEGRLQEAIVQYRNALRADARFGEARWRLAETYAQAGNPQAAFREYVRAADLLPDDAEAQIRAGSYLLMARQFEDARMRAERAVQLDPGNVEALILRANATAGLRDVAGAIREIEEALETQSEDGRMYTSLGAFRFIEGQHPEAEAAFKSALRLSPASVEARLALANFYWATGRPSDAEQALVEARAIDSSHVLLNRMLAALYLTTRRVQEAEAPLKTAAEHAGDAGSALALADYYIQTGQPDAAIATLKPLAEGENASNAAMLRLAQIERNAGRHDSARQMLDALLKKEPRNGTALTVLSGWHLRDREAARALETARLAVGADTASAPAHFALAQALIENRQPDEAVKALTEVLRLNPRIVPAQLMLSRLQLAQGNVEAAAQVAAEAKKAAPANPDVQLALARSLLAKGEIQRAEPEVRALVATYPRFAASHIVDGLLRMAKRDARGARAAFHRALEHDPNAVEALAGLLALDAASNDVASAVGRIEERIAKNPESAPLQFVAARTYMAANQPEKAERALRSVLQLDPHNFSAYMSLGRVLAMQQRLDEALAEFDSAARRRPDQVGAATMAAMIVQMQNKDADAQKRYEAIVAANQRAPIAANNLAWLYAERGGNLDVALQLAQSAKSQLPDVPEINDTLGWVYYKKDLPQLAIPPLEQSVASDPKNAGYQLRLGLAYAKTGQNEKARAALETALQLQPDMAEAAEARRVLESSR